MMRVVMVLVVAGVVVVGGCGRKNDPEKPVVKALTDTTLNLAVENA
jgi:hypothetical protein